MRCTEANRPTEDTNRKSLFPVTKHFIVTPATWSSEGLPKKMQLGIFGIFGWPKTEKKPRPKNQRRRRKKSGRKKSEVRRFEDGAEVTRVTEEFRYREDTLRRMELEPKKTGAFWQLGVWAADTARLREASKNRKTEPRRIWEITKPKTEATVELKAVLSAPKPLNDT